MPATRIPCGPSSIPAIRVSISTPAFALQYAPSPTAGTFALIEAMLTIAPLVPAARIACASCFTERNTPVRHTSMTVFHSSNG